MSSLATLEGLGEDILLRILASCDIYTTLCVSQVNRYLHDITSTKQLWVLHLQDLYRHSLIELPPTVSLPSLSTAGLVDLVRRLVVGPDSWAPGRSPQVSTEISIRLEEDRPDGFLGDCRVKLLDGGRHILFPRETSLELWDTTAQRLSWSGPLFPLIHFAAKPTARGIILAALPCDQTGLVATLEIHEIDALTGESTVHLKLSLLGHDCVTDPIMCDDLVLVPMRATLIETALLVDWRAQRYMFFELSYFSEAPAVGLVPGHLIVAAPCSRINTDGPQLRVYNLKAFASLWRPLTDIAFTDAMNLLAHPADLSLLLPACDHPTTEIEMVQLGIHASPLRADTYKMDVYVWGLPRRGVTRFSCIAKMDPADGRVTLTPVSSGRAPDALQDIQQLSYAGYAVDGMTHRLWHVASQAQAHVLGMAEHCQWTHLSAGSGAVTRVFPDRSAVVVSYYC